MDHNEWLAYEEKCIQERPPACVTACPIHVDARRIMSLVQSGNFRKAFDTYRKTVPFPAVVGRICDHPCELQCKRGQVGDAVSIGAIERYCVENYADSRVTSATSPKGKAVAIVGSGLSGMTVGFDLARKGYKVAIFEEGDRIGGRLWELPDERLPRTVINNQMDVLQGLDVDIKLNSRVSDIAALHREFDAVYVGTGPATDFAAVGLKPSGVDNVTFSTGNDGVFAGGGIRLGHRYSPILTVSDGRRAATSIDRFLQHASLTAVRENEGAYETELYTNTEGITPLAVVAPRDVEQGYSEQEVVEEAQRCLDCQCLECVKNCEYLAHYGAYPKKYARQINQNLRIVMGIHGANSLINSCSLCGLCTEVCPTNFDMSKLVREARTEMVDNHRMPPSAHDFPLRDMNDCNSEDVAFSRHQPGHSSSHYVFFPGCQLTGSAPHHVEQVYDYLVDRLPGGVGLMTRCCGAPAEWAGRTELFEQTLSDLRAQWQQFGKPVMVLACSSCYQVFQAHLPEIDIISLWQIYDEFGLPDMIRGVDKCTMAVHDACTTRYEPEIHQSIRNVLERIGVQIEELPNNRERTECCGYGGLAYYANRAVAEKTTLRRSQQSPRDYVVYCAMCKDVFMSNGKRAYHILDLIYGPDKPIGASDEGLRLSEKRTHRLWLRQKLLSERWGETVSLKEQSYGDVQLVMSSEVKRLLENRLILQEDVQQVIAHAESSDEKLVSWESGHTLAFYRPTNVTYWVEYTVEPDAYRIYNAYSHRMMVEKK